MGGGPENTPRERRGAEDTRRWQSRTGWSVVVSGAIFFVPVLISILAASVLVHSIPRPQGALIWAWWVAIIIIPWLIYLAVSHVAQGFVPLASLLKMTLVFPDKAPKRAAIARRAGSIRTLQRQLEKARELGVTSRPQEAAEQILALVTSLNVHDKSTRGHSERVRVLTDMIAEQLQLPVADRDRLRWSALLHDIGKLTVPAEILNKNGKPTASEWTILQQHPIEGAVLAAPLADWLGEWMATIPQHHERYDGKGYPAGLAGEEISLGGRIVAVADSYETMTAVRAYKKAMPTATARRELVACSGTQFDPMVVRAFLEVSVGKHRVAGGTFSMLGDLTPIKSLPRVEHIVATAGNVVSGAAVVAGVGVTSMVAHPAQPAVAPTTVSAAATGGSPAAAIPGRTSGSPTSSSGHSHTTTSTTTPGDTSKDGGDTNTLSAPQEVPTDLTETPGDGQVTLGWTLVPVSSDSTNPGASSTSGSTSLGASGTLSAMAVSRPETAILASDSTSETTTTLPSAPSDGPLSGLPSDDITGYQITPWVNGVAQSPIDVASASTSYTVTNLTDGTTYSFTIAAMNAAGLGVPSAPSAPVIPSTVPNGPKLTGVTTASGTVTVHWDPPSNTGGIALNGYRLVAYIGTTAVAFEDVRSGIRSASLAGLNNGTSYRIVVQAINADGSSPMDESVATATPSTVPATPEAPSVQAASGQVLLTWTPPADNGSDIIGYQVTPWSNGTSGTPVDFGSPATTESVSGLTNGTAYAFTVAAINADGVGTASALSGAVTPVSAPEPPTILTATPDNGAIRASWSAPTDTGGLPITHYVVTATTPGGAPIVVVTKPSVTTAQLTGLTNGTTYSVTVEAQNELGPSPATPAASPVTPCTTADPPTISSIAASAEGATLTWSPPAATGGAAIAGYRLVVTDSTAGTTKNVLVPAGALSDTVEGLTAEDSITITVAARNAAGYSAPSASSAAVIPYGPAAAPSGASATPGNQEATISWTAPSDDGASPITGYVITPSANSTALAPITLTSWTTSGTTLSATVPGLTNGTPYRFTVAAINAAGPGAPSTATKAVTPLTTPGAPTGLGLTTTTTTATLSWARPGDDGGSTITGYTVTVTSSGNVTTTANLTRSTTTYTAKNLTPGSTYTFTVAATNAAGTGVAQSITGAASDPPPSALTTAPVALAGDGQVTLTWTTPSDAGTAITGYVITPIAGGVAASPIDVGATTTNELITGLTNGTTYQFTVAAVNSSGSSPASPDSNAVTPSSELLTNGDFETPSVTTASYEYVDSGASTLTGWTVSGNSIEIDHGAVQPEQGSQSLDLSGTAPGGVSQTVSTTPGASYVLTWWEAGNPVCGTATKQMAVDWGGTAISGSPFTFSTSGHSKTSMGWVQHTSTLVAATDLTVVSFADASTPASSCGATLDNVTLVTESGAVIVPSTLRTTGPEGSGPSAIDVSYGSDSLALAPRRYLIHSSPFTL